MLRLFNRYFFVPTIVSLVVESGLLLFAVWFSSRVRGWIYFGRLGLDPPPFFDSNFGIRAAIFILVVILALYFNGLYDLGERLSRRQAWIRGARALLSLARMEDSIESVIPGLKKKNLLDVKYFVFLSFTYLFP